jgi:hypothetical protein
MSQTIATIGFGVIATIILLFALLVLWKIYNEEIDIRGLLAETPPPGVPPDEAKASLSRFQFLVFTFVIAGLFLLLSIESGSFVEVPQNVLVLLGISGGSYVISKTVGPSQRKDDASTKSKTARPSQRKDDASTKPQ